MGVFAAPEYAQYTSLTKKCVCGGQLKRNGYGDEMTKCRVECSGKEGEENNHQAISQFRTIIKQTILNSLRENKLKNSDLPQKLEKAIQEKKNKPKIKQEINGSSLPVKLLIGGGVAIVLILGLSKKVKIFNMVNLNKNELAEVGVQFDLHKVVASCQKVGGTLTNFREIGRKLKELQGLNDFSHKDSFQNLVKKEQAILEKKRNKLQKIYEGIVNLKKQPDCLFIIGLNKEKTAFKEAKKIGIPVIAVCNSNCNPQLVDYVIPGNDENVKSITFFAGLVANSIIEAKEKVAGDSSSTIQEEKAKEVNV
nr:5886_t:CDS:2 [Entrophospora candida]